MTDPRALASAFAPELPSMLAMIERVVSIDSGTYHTPGVSAVIDAFAAFLEGAGFAIERTPLAGRADQLTARRVLGNGKRLLVLGHADTVWPAGTVAEWPFGNDGKFLTGPGVGDMKSCVVMALHALRMLLRGPLPGIGSITVLIVPDEEIGSPGSRAWIEGEARVSDACLTLEPCRPEGKVVVGRGAVGALYVRATGVTAHVGPARALGASAISALAPLVAPLEALTDPKRGVGTSVGIFRGGAARQVIPAEAEFHLDLRATDQAGADWLVAEARRVAEVKPADPRVSVSVEGGFYRPPFPTRQGTRALYAIAQRVGAAIGTPVGEVVSAGGSDGSFAAALGVPTLDGLGPICHESCSRRERVEVDSIVPRGALFAGLVMAIGGEGVS
ncbi:MAG: M20 family metallopeptidase [Acetobacteraceae bacterium]